MVLLGGGREDGKLGRVISWILIAALHEIVVVIDSSSNLMM